MWGTAGEEREEAKKEYVERLRVLEEVLGDKAFFGGETFGFTDIALVPYYSWFFAYETCAKFSVEAECPRLISWAKRCMERESVSESLPDPEKIYMLLLELTRKAK